MKQEKAVSFLAQFLPPGSFEQVAPFFKTNTIHLSITYERKSVLGDYRTPTKAIPFHRISINSNLNPYSFLVTLLHELAHMFTYNQYGTKAPPHGKEWKEEFRRILIPFLGKQFFPFDVEKALHAYLQDPAASTCTDPRLFKALYKYDEHLPGYKLVDDLHINAFFETEGGHLYQKIEKMRTRTKCKNITNGKMYYFQGIVEVKETLKKG
jgi:predicted SprT family Zn-dependent metalloprotease